MAKTIATIKTSIKFHHEIDADGDTPAHNIATSDADFKRCIYNSESMEVNDTSSLSGSTNSRKIDASSQESIIAPDVTYKLLVIHNTGYTSSAKDVKTTASLKVCDTNEDSTITLIAPGKKWHCLNGGTAGMMFAQPAGDDVYADIMVLT